MRQTSAPPPRGLLHPPAVDGNVAHERVLPVPALAGSVAHFWSVVWDLGAPKDVSTLSHPTLHFVFEASNGVTRAELAGVPERRFERTIAGRGWVFGIKLRPAMGRAFVAADAAAFTNRVVPLVEVLGAPMAKTWTDAIALASTPTDRIAAITPLLVAAQRAVDPATIGLRDLCERIATDPSIIRTEQIAALAHQTPRSLQRHFARDVGVSPKWVIRRYRLHEAAERLRAPEPPSLAALAAELGYADQAHFSRDFSAAVGQSPRRFLRALATR